MLFLCVGSGVPTDTTAVQFYGAKIGIFFRIEYTLWSFVVKISVNIHDGQRKYAERPLYIFVEAVAHNQSKDAAYKGKNIFGGKEECPLMFEIWKFPV